MPADVTCLMVACNAEAYLTRAINSALSQVDRLILVDDGSTDKSSDIAEKTGGSQVQIIRFENNRGIGAARQAAVNACKTDIACWLDADDIWCSQRISKLLPFIRAGADYVFDESELFSDIANKKVKDLLFPDFIKQKDGLLYLFGRNYLPTIGVPMARLAALKEINYNPGLRQAEDNGHLLKALSRNKSIRLSEGVSYREYERPDSVSRDLEKQNFYLSQSYTFIDQSGVEQRIVESGLSRTEQFVVLNLFFVRVKNWQAILRTCASWSLGEGNTDCQVAWMQRFFSGVAEYHLGNVTIASRFFESGIAIAELPELYNNLGVCQARLGKDGRPLFQRALALKTGYIDAERNMTKNGQHLTNLPLRQLAYRGDYRNRLPKAKRIRSQAD
ncbi:MAG: hypothetical protein CSA50_07695 [Gammaproteobacteria bacterium]|nr:MAG: hypothetical protein CSA50_07695 [Gammaproteobacteria bacterium]